MKNSKARPIAHFEKKYLICPEGRVQSLQDYKYLTPSQNRNGYWKVSLGCNGKRQQALLHRLVALHFIPNPYGYDQVNHIDGDKSNNSLDNLEWVTREQNAQHALKTGLRSGYMSIEEKEKYLTEVLQGATVREIAQRIGRREETLSKMLRVLAGKQGRKDIWTQTMKERRKNVAIRNLATINS